jgi:hypothetical protein
VLGCLEGKKNQSLLRKLAHVTQDFELVGAACFMDKSFSDPGGT